MSNEHSNHLKKEQEHLETQKQLRQLEEQEHLEALEIFGTVTTTKEVITQTISSPSNQTEITKLKITKPETDAELWARAETILSTNPYQFLLDDLHKRVPGNQLISRMLILSFMSMHPKISILLHQFITGASGRGKSYEVHQCANLLHPVYRIPFEKLTPKALNYYCEDDGTSLPDELPTPGIIKNKFLYLDDVEEDDMSIIKTLGNNDGSDPSGLNVINGKTVRWAWDGYPLTVCSKVSLPETDEDGQIKSRYLIYGVEESPEHLKEITDTMIQKLMKQSPASSISMDPVCQYILHYCLSLNINRIELTSSSYPAEIEPRNLNFYTALLQSHALLNCKKRKISNGILYANSEDLTVINALWEEISDHNNSNLTTLEIRILSNLHPKSHSRTRDQTIPGMKDLNFGSQPTISAALDKLEQIGIISHVGTRPKSYFLL